MTFVEERYKLKTHQPGDAQVSYINRVSVSCIDAKGRLHSMSADDAPGMLPKLRAAMETKVAA